MEEGGSGGGGPMPTVCLCVLSSTPRSDTDDRLIEDEIDDAMDDDMEETGEVGDLLPSFAVPVGWPEPEGCREWPDEAMEGRSDGSVIGAGIRSGCAAVNTGVVTFDPESLPAPPLRESRESRVF